MDMTRMYASLHCSGPACVLWVSLGDVRFRRVSAVAGQKHVQWLPYTRRMQRATVDTDGWRCLTTLPNEHKLAHAVEPDSVNRKLRVAGYYILVM